MSFESGLQQKTLQSTGGIKGTGLPVASNGGIKGTSLPVASTGVFFQFFIVVGSLSLLSSQFVEKMQLTHAIGSFLFMIMDV
jgi:hypothetical protein